MKSEVGMDVDDLNSLGRPRASTWHYLAAARTIRRGCCREKIAGIAVVAVLSYERLDEGDDTEKLFVFHLLDVVRYCYHCRLLQFEGVVASVYCHCSRREGLLSFGA
ncbi:hypothetical protein KY285_020666 [Solanum tuberosum]|nr:hypothetical protein KY285_020666 [Solanum tuberosum]